MAKKTEDLAARVLAAVAQKRDAAAALTVQADKDEERFRKDWKLLIDTLDKLKAARVGTKAGPIDYESERSFDDQQRKTLFTGIAFWFGPRTGDHPRGGTNTDHWITIRFCRVAAYGDVTKATLLDPLQYMVRAKCLYVYDKKTIEHYESYGGYRTSGTYHGEVTVNPDRIFDMTQLLINWIAKQADR